MARVENLQIHPDDEQELDRLVEEYRFIGREVTVDRPGLTVTVLAMPSDYKRKRERDNRRQARRERTEDPTAYGRR